MPAKSSVKEYINLNSLIPFLPFSRPVSFIFPDNSCLVFKLYFISFLPCNVILMPDVLHVTKL